MISSKATMNHFARKEHERKREEEKIQRAKALEDAQRERDANIAAALAMGNVSMFALIVLTVACVHSRHTACAQCAA